MPAWRRTGSEARATRNLLMLIELAYPGLVDVDPADQEAIS